METNMGMPLITIDTFIEIIKRQLNEGNLRPVMGLGKGGIGKSESMEELARNLGIGYTDIRLLLYSETDLKGIPYPDEKHEKTIWLQNKILPDGKPVPDSDRDLTRGILVLDEITSCAKSVRTAAYQLLNERRLGEYVLPDGWLVVCLGNGEEDGGDFEGMEGNFANRGSMYRIEVDVESWKNWAISHGVNPLVVGYINFKSNDLHTYDPDSDDNYVFASPRSWKAVSDILNSPGCDITDVITRLRIAGNIGNVVASSFYAFCSYKKQTVSVEEILDNKLMFKPENTEIANITISSVVNVVTSEINRECEAHVKEYSKTVITHVINALDWFASLKAEWAIMAIKDLKRANIMVVSQLLLNRDIQDSAPNFKSFFQKNAAVFK